jgi:hypothetical protein
MQDFMCHFLKINRTYATHDDDQLGRDMQCDLQLTERETCN